MNRLRITALIIILPLLFVLIGVFSTYLSLAGTSWQLEQMIINGESQESYYAGTPTLRFEKLAIDGHDGCNGFQGFWVPLMFGRLLTIPTVKTEMACSIVDNQSGETIIDTGIYEDQFVNALTGATHIHIDGQTMHVYFGKGGTDVIVFMRLP